MAQETQNFIDEIERPSFYTHVQRKTMVTALSAALCDNGQQIAKLRGLLQDAEITEVDDSLRGRMEMLFQNLDALLRQNQKLADEARRLHQSSRFLAQQYADFKVEAVVLGYAVR